MKYTQNSPLGWRSWLVLYRTKRMAKGVFLGHSLVQRATDKPYTIKQLKKEVAARKKWHGWSEILGVYKEGYQKVCLS